jgi:hypothetical protein
MADLLGERVGHGGGVADRRVPAVAVPLKLGSYSPVV